MNKKINLHKKLPTNANYVFLGKGKVLVLEAVSLCFPVCLLRLGVLGPHIKKASGKVATVQLADEQMISFFWLIYFLSSRKAVTRYRLYPHLHQMTG